MKRLLYMSLLIAALFLASSAHAAVIGGSDDVSNDSIWDAAGDLAVGTGANTATRLPIGENGEVLKSDGTTAVWGADNDTTTFWPTSSVNKEITWANSFANARRDGDGTTSMAYYTHATYGPQQNCVVSGVENDCNYSRWLLTGKTFSWLANDRTTVIGRITSAASSGTWSHVSLNVEDTNNVITTVSKVNLKPVGCSGTTGTVLWSTNATLAPTATCTAGSTNTTLIQGYLDFPDSDGEYQAQTEFRLPSDFTGAIDVQLFWRAAATTGDVVWQVATMCTSDGEIEDVAWNTASTVTDTTKGTTLQLNTAAITALTITNCAAGDLMHVKFFRQRTHASDTITGVVSLKSVELTVRRAQ